MHFLSVTTIHLKGRMLDGLGGAFINPSPLNVSSISKCNHCFITSNQIADKDASHGHYLTILYIRNSISLGNVSKYGSKNNHNLRFMGTLNSSKNHLFEVALVTAHVNRLASASQQPRPTESSVFIDGR